MRVTQTDLEGVLLIEPTVFEDQRGCFLEAYHEQRYAEAGIRERFIQDNFSWSKGKTLRGLHYQLHQPQGKLVMVLEGAVFDVVLDIRKGSPTFGRWYGVELSSENMRQLYIPPGYAHGFCVTSDGAGLLYKCTRFYAAHDERGISWNDPALDIAWPIDTPLMSPKDRAYQPLAEMRDEIPLYKDGEGR